MRLNTVYIALVVPATILASEVHSLLLSSASNTITPSASSPSAPAEPQNLTPQALSPFSDQNEPFIFSPSSTPSAQPNPKPSPTPTPTLGSIEHELLIRQAAGQVDGQAAQASVPTQMSPVFTELVYANGQMIPLLFTQTFASIPDQWPGPSAGSIGLGSITGQVGVVRTKRSEPTGVQEVVEGLVRKIGHGVSKKKSKSSGATSGGARGRGEVRGLMVASTVVVGVLMGGMWAL